MKVYQGIAWLVLVIGLAKIVSGVLDMLVPDARADCQPWGVRDYCCPAACAVKKGPGWPEADRVLRGCMAGLGCPASDQRDATVAMTCECSR